MLLEQPLSWYTNENVLQFHLLSVGEGLMTLIIFPDETIMLFDCNITDDNEDGIIAFMNKLIPEKYNYDTKKYEKLIDVFVNSHRDEDHYRGLKKVNDKFPIKSIWDSGQSGATTDSDDYQYYMKLRRTLKANDPKNLYVPIPSNIPIKNYGGADIYCLASEEDFTRDHTNRELYETSTKIQHTNSMVLLIEYGNRKLLMTGDSDWKSWRDKIVPNFGENDFLRSNILIASHHGSRSFFTSEENDKIDVQANPDTTFIDSIKLIRPDITLISCGYYESAHHPNKDALNLYEENTSESQVYTTYLKGHFSGYIDINGHFTVAPVRFKNNNKAPSNVGFKIKCAKYINGKKEDVINNAYIEIGCNLKFSIEPYGELIEPFNQLKVIWEVSNGGQGKDFFHQEIYYKGENETDGLLSFSRDLSYVGTHLLRCRVINKKRKYDITQVFVVNGIKY